MCVYTLLLHAATALLIPPPPITAAVWAAPRLAASPTDLAAPRSNVFPAPTLLLAEETISPAKAKILAAKQAAEDKAAARVVANPVATAAPKASVPVKPKTFAELLQASIDQKESITGKLSDTELEKLTAKVRAAYPGIQ